METDELWRRVAERLLIALEEARDAVPPATMQLALGDDPQAGYARMSRTVSTLVETEIEGWLEGRPLEFETDYLYGFVRRRLLFAFELAVLAASLPVTPPVPEEAADQWIADRVLQLTTTSWHLAERMLIRRPFVSPVLELYGDI